MVGPVPTRINSLHLTQFVYYWSSPASSHIWDPMLSGMYVRWWTIDPTSTGEAGSCAPCPGTLDILPTFSVVSVASVAATMAGMVGG